MPDNVQNDKEKVPEVPKPVMVELPEGFTADDLKEYKKLNEENKKYRLRLKEFEEKKAAEDAERMKEQGKYKELHDQAMKELTELKAQAEELEVYRADAKAQLDEALKALGKDEAELLEQLPLNTIAAKLQWARKLAKSKPSKTNANDPRPGAKDTETVETVLETYRKADIRKKADILIQYKKANPQIYAALLTA